MEESVVNEHTELLALVKAAPPVDNVEVLFNAQRVVHARVVVEHVLLKHVGDEFQEVS